MRVVRVQGSMLSQRESLLFTAREISIRGLMLSYDAITTLAYRLKVRGEGRALFLPRVA